MSPASSVDRSSRSPPASWSSFAADACSGRAGSSPCGDLQEISTWSRRTASSVAGGHSSAALLGPFGRAESLSALGHFRGRSSTVKSDANPEQTILRRTANGRFRPQLLGGQLASRWARLQTPALLAEGRPRRFAVARAVSGRRIHRHPTTISRRITASSGRCAYRPAIAQIRGARSGACDDREWRWWPRPGELLTG